MNKPEQNKGVQSSGVICDNGFHLVSNFSSFSCSFVAVFSIITTFFCSVSPLHDVRGSFFLSVRQLHYQILRYYPQCIYKGMDFNFTIHKKQYFWQFDNRCKNQLLSYSLKTDGQICLISYIKNIFSPRIFFLIHKEKYISTKKEVVFFTKIYIA